MVERKNHLSLSARVALLGLSAIVIILDQITKHIVRNNINLFEIKPVMPFWNWTLAYNEGAAFSFLSHAGGWQKIFFGVIAILVSAGLIYYILSKTYHVIAGIAFSFILGGALGNLVDRITAGKVTDFIDWYVGNYHWPAFNLADSFICVGVALLIIDSLFISKR